jgi:hypothetical protein
MEGALTVYEKPYETAEPVVWLDEKPVTSHNDIRPPVAAALGNVAKRDNEYKSWGTANVFSAVEPKAGRHFSLVMPTAQDRNSLKLSRPSSDYPAAQTFIWRWTN